MGVGVSPALSSVLDQALGQSVSSALAIEVLSQFGFPRVPLSPEEQTLPGAGGFCKAANLWLDSRSQSSAENKRHAEKSINLEQKSL